MTPEAPTSRIDIAEGRLLPAVRLKVPVYVELGAPPTIPGGLWGLSFAPTGLTGCDEFNFYRLQWGLPDRFSKLAWRESNCRNEDGVRTSCCHGYLQLWIALQLEDVRVIDRYHECGVYSYEDVNSDIPLEKQKQLCAASVLFSIVGYSAWSN